MDIMNFDGAGYRTMVVFNGWRVAVLKSGDRARDGKVTKVERHNKTDEVFILMQGQAELIIGKEQKRYPMEYGKIYNVKCGEWHDIILQPNSQVGIVENFDTGKENSEYFFFEQ